MAPTAIAVADTAAIAASVDATAIAVEDATAIGIAYIAADPVPDMGQYTQHQSPQRQWL